ncbi:ABC transporter substrate-binding protein [Micropruina sonneratiae]|uniref:ABC transporter substrate-binding protein n=1 Tax=Micropruina sonneratiae TaxID=2986940 RepID=UPI002226DB99|nr:extracellular solute-binding protein [Micropruina sp. KQZ13P-5]MCW3158058.1 extracellular solute-binding protein [Micropruina sp. KQZ13P-5]
MTPVPLDGATGIARRTLLGGGLAASALALAACSGPSATESSAAPTAASTEVIGSTDLTVYAWTNGTAIDENFKSSVTAFNKEFDGKFTAKINFLPYDQYWQKIQLQYAANQPFDMYYWDVQAYAHYKKDLLQNVQPAVSASELADGSTYPVALFDPWRFDGTDLYAIPENIQSMSLFYNKKHFDDAGIAYPDATWTWDKVIEVAGQLTQKSGDKVTRWGLDIGDLGAWWGIQTLAWAAGTAFFDKPLEPTAFQMTDPKVVEALRFVQDLMWTKHIAPRPDERDANNSAGGFAGGVVSMMPGGTWGIASYQQMKDGWGIAPLPLYQGQSVMPYWLGGWVIPKASAALTAAQTFAIWRATTFQEQMAADHDWIPIQDAARTSETMLKGMPDGFEAAMQSLPSARIGDLYTENSQKILNEVYSTHLDELFRNKATPEAVAQAIQDEATALL